MKVERRAVVDQPQPAVPHQHVRVARSAIDVGHERIEPHDRRCELRRWRIDDRIESRRAGQIIERQIQSHARANQCLDLGIGFRARKVRIELHQHEFRHQQRRGARDLTGDEFRDQRVRTLACAPELEHVQPQIIRFDDGRQRSTFAERGHVAGGVEGV